MNPSPMAVASGPGDEAHAGGRSNRTLAWAAALLAGLALAGLVLGSMVEGEEAAGGGEGEELLEEVGGGWAGWGSLGLMAGTFFFGWARTGVALTRPSSLLRRWRVDAHVWTSTVALALALLHTVELVVLGEFVGWLSGTLATVYLVGLFATGWWRPYLVDRWGLSRWRIVHWVLAVGVLVLSGLHWLAIEGALPRP